ncbi:hypothetical protein ABB04_00055 [Bacillus tropicus]|nr:hypothetical protein [Bacillus tropicus]OTY63201.1 hypothetical protein BK748_00060 [Bacillus thuringiensis serovar graciosensis]
MTGPTGPFSEIFVAYMGESLTTATIASHEKIPFTLAETTNPNISLVNSTDFTISIAGGYMMICTISVAGGETGLFEFVLGNPGLPYTNTIMGVASPIGATGPSSVTIMNTSNLAAGDIIAVRNAGNAPVNLQSGYILGRKSNYASIVITKLS